MTDGGRVVPDGLVDAMYRHVTKQRALVFLTDEMWDDLGYPPRAKGLAYWQRKEREAIAARRLSARLRRRAWRVQRFMADIPRRLGNARAALAGEWERSEDD